jgi:hypothetical protein
MEDMMGLMVHYFSTKNRLSPFVAMLSEGDWPDRAAMVKTVRSGTALGKRPAIQSEIELWKRSTRCVAITWPSVKELLWDHQEGLLETFYPGLIASLRKHSREIKTNLGVVEKKKSIKQAEKEKVMLVVRENRLRRKIAADPQIQLFEAFEAA